MLKLVVVVVVGVDQVEFEKEKLSAYFDDTINCLIVNDLAGEKPQKIGAFAKWDYWIIANE